MATSERSTGVLAAGTGELGIRTFFLIRRKDKLECGTVIDEDCDIGAAVIYAGSYGNIHGCFLSLRDTGKCRRDDMGARAGGR